ncbi:unnamed protein product [Gemmataceae bacterium]|nr:unnamed protein product [Gemmataceae bacterium]VTU00711.1 unnamed protein product [Gemmataceae bacterium]
MLLRFVGLCVVAGVVVAPALPRQPAKPADNVVDKAEKKHVVRLSARLDRADVHPGDLVRLTEVVPAGKGIKVFAANHEFILVGDYDPKLGELVNLDRRENVFVRLEDRDPFEGLHSNLLMAHGFPLNVRTPREQGIEFEFRPNRIGIFSIVANWLVDDKDEGKSQRWYSQPVVLVVRPPFDAAGKPVVKPEWLDFDQP